MFCKKRPFVLLEIILACALLSICLGPLMRGPLQAYQTQMKKLRQIEEQRLADLSFMEIKIKFLGQEIPFKDLPKRKKETIFPLPPALLQIPHLSPQLVERRAIFKWFKEKPRENGGRVLLLDVEIEFAPFEKKETTYSYRLVLQKEG